MNAVQALEAARAAGITIALDGDDLMLQASAQPPEYVLELLSHHKRGIVVLLRPDRSWTAEDWRALYDERAGIAEFDGGLSRREAEAQAFDSCVIEWLNRNRDHSLAWTVCGLRWRTSFRSPCGPVRGRAGQSCLVACEVLGCLARPAKGHGGRCIGIHGDRGTRRSSRRPRR